MSETPIAVPIPKWAYSAALEICVARQDQFRNQFTTGKLKASVADDPRLREHVEGVIGYIGDICACEWLGIDAREMLRSMVVDTDLLTHRDCYDFVYRGHRLDVKTELYPPELFDAVIARKIDARERFGCRLINANQFRENSGNIDVYLFATIDTPNDPRLARYWYPVGWLTKARVQELAPRPQTHTPAGARLWVPAHAIPNNSLEPPDTLPRVSGHCDSTVNRTNSVDEAHLARLDRRRYDELCRRIGIL